MHTKKDIDKPYLKICSVDGKPDKSICRYCSSLPVYLVSGIFGIHETTEDTK